MYLSETFKQTTYGTQWGGDTDVGGRHSTMPRYARPTRREKQAARVCDEAMARVAKLPLEMRAHILPYLTFTVLQLFEMNWHSDAIRAYYGHYETKSIEISTWCCIVVCTEKGWRFHPAERRVSGVVHDMARDVWGGGTVQMQPRLFQSMVAASAEEYLDPL